MQIYNLYFQMSALFCIPRPMVSSKYQNFLQIFSFNQYPYQILDN